MHYEKAHNELIRSAAIVSSWFSDAGNHWRCGRSITTAGSFLILLLDSVSYN